MGSARCDLLSMFLQDRWVKETEGLIGCRMFFLEKKGWSRQENFVFYIIDMNRLFPCSIIHETIDLKW